MSTQSLSRNVLLVLTDQERDGGLFEPAGLTDFRATQLPRRAQLAASGIRFAQHRIASSACVPSRASLLTGYSPAVHGVRQTDGLAKEANDSAMRWLRPEQVPTLGHRFEAAGFESIYIGKWHLSHADLLDAAGRARPPSQDDVERYREADPLAAYGFHGWVGPEPHGADPRNAGLARDPGYIAQATGWLRARAAQPERPPFLLVVCLVNPHDMVMWPAWSLWKRKHLGLEGLPFVGPAASEAWIPDREPSVLAAYRERYGSAYGPRNVVDWLYRRDREGYRKFYASLLRRSDAHLGELLDVLDDTGLAENTHVVFSSDHGELLGAHGGLHQKWYNAFEETVRVPLMIRSPDHGAAAGRVVEDLSDHLDLLPTLLGLVGIEPKLPEAEARRFVRAPALPGRDLLRTATTGRSYFVTYDHILAGDAPKAAFGKRFPALARLFPFPYEPPSVRNTAVEALVARLPEGGHFKLVRYFDPDSVNVGPDDEWSLFDLEQDPSEMRDLARERDAETLRQTLICAMDQERARVS